MIKLQATKMNHSVSKGILSFALILSAAMGAEAKQLSYDIFGWNLDIENTTGAVSLSHRGDPVIKNSIAQFAIDGDTLSFAQCGSHAVNVKEGKGLLENRRPLP